MALPLILFALFSGQEAVSAGAPVPDPAAVVSQAEYTPEGAPKDDYQFTAWCRGVLEGHMALADRVQPILPLDEVQQKVGNAYLNGYDEALEAGKDAQSAEALQAAADARAAARANWDRAMKADLQLAADTYLAWQLPGRCEHAAKRVAGRDDLFRMEQADDASAPLAATAATVTPTALTVEAPAETAAADDGMGLQNLVPVVDGGASDVDFQAIADAPAAEVDAVVEASVAADAPDAGAVEAPEPAEAEAPTEEDGRRVVSMPKKGRLLPFGKRE